jgi:8-oxo-dGTP pyrophosphatase MutT (NUDIX family)
MSSPENYIDDNKKKICGNCGDLGHIYRNCRQPITSFGIVLFKTVKNRNYNIFDNIEFLMVQRRDSLSYVDFVRGKYNFENTKYLKQLFNDMSERERTLISNGPFDIIWRDLWRDHNTHTFKGEYDISKNKYDNLVQGVVFEDGSYETIKTLLDNSKFCINTPEWEFPKGRRNSNETDLECAIREFEEETGISNNDYKILHNVLPFQEMFIGSNNIKYKIVYYLGYYTSNDGPFFNENNLVQTMEINDLKWVSLQNCYQIIKSHFVEKKKIITSIFYYLMVLFESDPNIKIENDTIETINTITNIAQKCYRPLKQIYLHKKRFQKLN